MTTIRLRYGSLGVDNRRIAPEALEDLDRGEAYAILAEGDDVPATANKEWPVVPGNRIVLTGEGTSSECIAVVAQRCVGDLAVLSEISDWCESETDDDTAESPTRELLRFGDRAVNDRCVAPEALDPLEQGEPYIILAAGQDSPPGAESGWDLIPGYRIVVHDDGETLDSVAVVAANRVGDGKLLTEIARWFEGAVGQRVEVPQEAMVTLSLDVPTGRQQREYKVLTQKDRFFRGKFDPERLAEALNAYAAEGWIVVATATASIPGVGNREEIIVIMERQL